MNLQKIKLLIKKNNILMSIIKPVYFKLNIKKDFSSKEYWEKRYVKGGNSGIGSYGKLALFKAETINDFINTNNVLAFSLKDVFSKWQVSYKMYGENKWQPLEDTAPIDIYGGSACRPVVADFDGDGKDDRAVMCPNEWRIAYSSADKFLAQRKPDGSRWIPLTYDTTKFSLPGRSYSGGMSYYQVMQTIDLFQSQNPNVPPPIPVDMAVFN